MSDVLLKVSDLRVDFRVDGVSHAAIDGVDFVLHKGQTLGLVGESGCGKSLTSLAIMNLLPSGGKLTRGSIFLDHQDLVKLSPSAMTSIRGRRIAMIFQEPMTALNPAYTVGMQIGEVFQVHQGYSKKQSLQASIEMLALVGIPDPKKRVFEYPHQLSGGMRQRVMIAIALACRPDVLIADEPTTALDVTIQAQILDLMKNLQKELGMAMLFITHDLGVVAQVCDEMAVMYSGRVIEQGKTQDIFDNPRHPYTKGLLSSRVTLQTPIDQPLKTIAGSVPILGQWPQGCRFANRCEKVSPQCQILPQLTNIADRHAVSCHHSYDAYGMHPNYSA